MWPIGVPKAVIHVQGLAESGCPWSPAAQTVMSAMPGDNDLVLPDPNMTVLIRMSWLRVTSELSKKGIQLCSVTPLVISKKHLTFSVCVREKEWMPMLRLEDHLNQFSFSTLLSRQELSSVSAISHQGHTQAVRVM